MGEGLGELDQFLRNLSADGAAVVERALGPEEVDAFEGSVVAELVDGLEALTGHRFDADGAPRSEVVDLLLAAAGPRAAELSRWLYDRLFASEVANALLEGLRPRTLAQAVFGGTPDDYHLRLESTVVRVDPPGPSPVRLAWHQEGRYDPTRASSIQFWMPFFRPSSVENGSVEYAVGSNVEPVLEVPLANPGAIGAQQYRVPDEVVDRYPHRIAEIPPGDVLVLGHTTMHRSSDPARQRHAKITLVGRCLMSAPGPS